MLLLHDFAVATGLRIKPSKSSDAPIRCNNINLDDVLQNFGGQIVGFRAITIHP